MKLKYGTWHKLNEALGFPLGVTNASSLGITNSFLLDEKKQPSKKKMDLDGGEIDVSDDGDEDDDDMGDDDGGDVSAPSISKKPVDSDCGCDKVPAMMMKKKMKKGIKEALFDSGYQAKEETPEVGSPEFRDYFFKSINSHFKPATSKNWSGINLGEEVLFEPTDANLPVAQEPKAGEVGFAPMGVVGGNSAAPVAPANWESGWTQMAEKFIQDAGLTASFQEWAKNK